MTLLSGWGGQTLSAGCERIDAMKWRKAPGADELKSLVNVALGNEKADLVVMGGDVVNVYTGEVLKGWSVATKGERIACVCEDARHTVGSDTVVVDAAGQAVIPGLIDGHAHLAHTHSTIDELLRYVIPSGTTTVISETLDICFALGYEGIIDFLEAVADQPIKIFVTAPSTYADAQQEYLDVVSPEEFRRLLARDEVLGIGESNWARIARADERLLGLFSEALAFGKRLEGHSAGAKGNRLAAFAASGNSSCHESITAQEALDRLRLGLHVMIREGDVRKDLAEVAAIKDAGIDFRGLSFTTDGIGARHVIEHGFLNSVVQQAIDLGFDPVKAVQMGSLNVATHFGLDHLVGGIAPGRLADIVIVPDLATIKPECVISNGRIVYRDDRLAIEPRRHAYPEWMRHTVRLPRELAASDFAVRVDGPAGDLTVRIIDLGTDIANKETHLTMPVTDGQIRADPEQGILKVAAIDRLTNSGRMFVGLIRGFGLTRGAMAATSAWDVANVVVVGASDEDMAAAVNRVRELQGGPVVYADGRVLAELPMPIGGQTSELPMPAIAEGLEGIQRAAEDLGCRLPYAHLMLNTLTTTIVPAIRISVSGLIRVSSGETVGLPA